MQTVDYLFINATVITMDEQYNLYNPGCVAVAGDSIQAVGPQDEMQKNYSGRQVVDCKGKVLMPGLINGHTHVPMTILRGLADDLRLDVWLLGYMMPVEREFVSPEFVRLGTSLACAEMIQSGITTFCDMYYFEEDVAIAAAEAGMRGICGETILKFPTPDAHSYEESLAKVREYIDRWKDHPLIIPAVAPHAPYTCTEEILRACATLAVEKDVPLVIHIAETALEVENSRRDNSMPVVPYVKKLNLFDAKVVAAHCVHIDEGEMRTFQHYNAGVVHNPSSNLKLASGIAQVKKMLDLNLNVGIGTDGTASNNDLDLFEELRLTSFLAKGSTGDPTVLPAKTVLEMATRMGAKALHIGHLTGSIEPNKRADLILIDIHPLHNSPRFQRDPSGVYAQIVYAAKSTDVTDVMINGRMVMRGRNLLTLQPNNLIAQSQVFAEKIDQFLVSREQSVVSKLIAIGGAVEEESFEVQVKVPVENAEAIIQTIKSSGVEILRSRHYKEYDTYFAFEDTNQGWLRYREDHFVGPDGKVTNVRNRLTHIGITGEHHYPDQVLLSRSRYIAPAAQTLRFYREYFKPVSEIQIDKERFRYLVRYKGTEFYINIDTIHNPKLGAFLEVKSRTWSRKDADQKSRLAIQLIECFGAAVHKAISEDYIEMINNSKVSGI